MHNIVVFVDDDARRTILREQALVQVTKRALGPFASITFDIYFGPRWPDQREGWNRRDWLRDVTPLKETLCFVNRHKQIWDAICRFRGAQQKIPIRTKREVKQLLHLLLYVTVEINQQVATGDQV